MIVTGSTYDQPRVIPQTEKTQKEKNDETKNQQEIQELTRSDKRVRAHEQAHMAAGGQYAGAATFTYEKGPDGRSYAVAGEVPIRAAKGRTPEETLQILEQVKKAALAPPDPSPQDLSAASAAEGQKQQVQRELVKQKIGYYKKAKALGS